MSSYVRDEFRISKFGLGHPDPDSFVRAQWPIPKWAYIGWRLFWCLWHVGWIIASGVTARLNQARYPEEGVKWFIYITNETLVLTTLTCTLDFAIVLYVTLAGNGSVLGLSNVAPKENDHHRKDTSPSEGATGKEEIVFQGEFTVEDGLKEHTTTWYLKVLWFLYNVISSTNILCTILYWTVDYNGPSDVVNFVVNSINSVFIVSNLLMAALPVQLFHFIYPMAYVALYFLFNFIYLEAGATDIRGRDVIYSIVNWTKPYPTALTITLGILVAVPVAHVVVFAIYIFKVVLHSKLNSAAYSTVLASSREVNGENRRITGYTHRDVDEGNTIEMDGSYVNPGFVS